MRPEIYPWNDANDNYLVKMTRDLDFLHYLPSKEYGTEEIKSHQPKSAKRDI